MRSLTAKDVMNPEVLSVRIDLTLAELAAFFTEKQITGAPVVDRDGKPVGVVSLMDLAENYETRRAFGPERAAPGRMVRSWEDKLEAEEARGFHIEEEDLLVGDIMTPTLYTVPEDTPVPTIAKTMVAGRVHRLLVTRHGSVVGIVTTMDLLKLLSGEEPRPRAAGTRRREKQAIR